MFDKLGKATRVAALPQPIVAADLHPDAYLKPASLVRVGNKQAWLVDFEIEAEAQTATTADLVLCSGTLELRVRYDMSAHPQITSRRLPSRGTDGSREAPLA